MRSARAAVRSPGHHETKGSRGPLTSLRSVTFGYNLPERPMRAGRRVADHGGVDGERLHRR